MIPIINISKPTINHMSDILAECNKCSQMLRCPDFEDNMTLINFKCHLRKISIMVWLLWKSLETFSFPFNQISSFSQLHSLSKDVCAEIFACPPCDESSSPNTSQNVSLKEFSHTTSQVFEWRFRNSFEKFRILYQFERIQSTQTKIYLSISF